MNRELIERLLYEDESTTLDFKKAQYRFAKASDEEKSELLKDILGFTNAWRRSEAFILIGVEDVRGGRGRVVGIAAHDHLDDHSLQQFVNNLTNRPVRFRYEAIGIEGTQIGVIRIEEQPRPIYLKRDFGRLKKNDVYVRRGSSTDPSQPASSDEIAQMGREQTTEAREPRLSVEFAAIDREHSLGSRIEWCAEWCEMPDRGSIPELSYGPSTVRMPGGQTFRLPDRLATSLLSGVNSNYYKDLADYLFAHRFFRQTRLVVTNTGDIPASEVRVELRVPNGLGIGIFDSTAIPKPPRWRENLVAMPQFDEAMFRRSSRDAGHVDIVTNDFETKLEFEYRNLQPGRRVWTDAFCIGIAQSVEAKLSGLVYAANLRQPSEFALAISANVSRTKLTVEELTSLADHENPLDKV